MKLKDDSPIGEPDVANEDKTTQDTQDHALNEKVVESIEHGIHEQHSIKQAIIKDRKKIITLTIIVLVTFIGLSSIWYFYGNKNAQTKPQDIVATTTDNKTKATDDTTEMDNNPVESTPIESITQTIDTTINITDTETWLDKPIAIADQGYYNTDKNTLPSSYFQVGMRGQNTIILTETPSGLGGYYDNLFEKKPDGSATAICLPSPNFEHTEKSDSYCTYNLISNLQYTNAVHYGSLAFPKQVTLDGGVSVFKLPDYDTIGAMHNGPEDTFVASVNGSSLVRRESTNIATRLVSISYFLKTPINTEIRMEYTPLDKDLEKYQWQVGDSSTDSLSAMTYGCGGMMTSVTKSIDITDSDTQRVGTSGSGLAVYEFKDLNNSLMQKAYDEYKSLNSSDVMSIDNFSKQHGVVLFKDIYGQWLVYVRSRLAPGGGCAKPVVYLYPTKQQEITVKVGADVKISDPYYNPKKGWTAIARPDGQLTVNGTKFDSLFWEGVGYGTYPEITQGTIVKQQDTISTIKIQLAQQSLSSKEINDFVDYWQDKLPDKPYIRLTWFNTAQMNQLASLFVSPRPDTMLRVFLDASGLDNPITIPVQNLASTPRIGFTVVEWGGLSSKKLY